MSECKKSLAAQVDELACRYQDLLGFAGDMLATIKLNHERGYLVAVNDEGKLNLERIIGRWSIEFSRIADKQ